MTAKTSEALAQVLHAAGFFELEERARNDEFHDFLSDDATPSITLDNELVKLMEGDQHQRMAATNIRSRHHEGEFDASKEESDAWAASGEGQDAFHRLVRQNLAKGE